MRIFVPFSGKSCWPGLASLALAGVALCAGSLAFAQNLANVPGTTPLQSRTGAVVAAVCGQFITANAANPAAAVGRDNGTDQGDLFGRCGDMVHNANALLGSGPTAFSLGLDAASLNGALTEIAHDETAAQGANTTQDTEVQVDNLSGRLSALRGGAKSISSAGLNMFDSSGRALAANGDWLNSTLAAGEDDTNSRFGLFITGDYSFGEDDGSSEEAGYDHDGYGVTAGADYKFSENFIGGAALGYTSTSNDFDGNGGDLDQDTYSLSLYASVYSGPAYLDGVVSYAFSDTNIDRNIVYGGLVRPVNRVAKGDTESDEWSFSIGAGYEFSSEGWSLTPMARATWSDADIDSYSETGASGLNLAVADQNVKSFETALGADLSYAHSTSFGVVIPNLRLEWAHEFDNDSRRISAQYVNDPRNNRFFVRTDS
ncbi:MAG TPA: autotransporter outer membrane beta-barrel domain-containing protein, partial [Alphaproteobacteria bacterium]|nr:autotransporter outer membrane beta-barrel domain-containing protein [Alphaproteobacteria bacterium]